MQTASPATSGRAQDGVSARADRAAGAPADPRRLRTPRRFGRGSFLAAALPALTRRHDGARRPWDAPEACIPNACAASGRRLSSDHDRAESGLALPSGVQAPQRAARRAAFSRGGSPPASSSASGGETACVRRRTFVARGACIHDTAFPWTAARKACIRPLSFVPSPTTATGKARQ